MPGEPRADITADNAADCTENGHTGYKGGNRVQPRRDRLILIRPDVPECLNEVDRYQRHGENPGSADIDDSAGDDAAPRDSSKHDFA